MRTDSDATQLADESRLGLGDAVLVVSITTLLALSLLIQVSHDPGAALEAVRGPAAALAARALDALQSLQALRQ